MHRSAEAAELFAFDNSYAKLPEHFFARLPPTPVAAPRLVKLNERLARELYLEPCALASEDGVALLAGNLVPGKAEPLAMAYAGHQFGSFVPQLGDGRAILLGEVIDRSGVRRDIQLKGAGPTPFSRNGDGRAALGPVLREYIVSEAMAALGIPTTRSLAAVTTGEMIWRETPLPGAVLTRVSSSHIRVGTFQFFAARGDVDGVRQLADHAIARHYPEARNTAKPYRGLLDGVIARQAELVASWLLVGFIHGVMNTDNMSIAGETIDYGPCAFLDAYHPEQVFSSIDTFGRYAFGNQATIAQWNLARLAETLLPLLGDDERAAIAEAKEALETFVPRFDAAHLAGFRRKLGLLRAHDGDEALGRDLLARMAENRTDFTLAFRLLSEAADVSGRDAALKALFVDEAAAAEWTRRWRKRLSEDGVAAGERREAMRAANPLFIPRNHLVEEAIAAAVQNADFAPFESMVGVLSHPFDDQPGFERYAAPPRPDQIVRQTFCGT